MPNCSCCGQPIKSEGVRTLPLIKEVWADVPGYENLYRISNLGRVESLPRMRYGRNHRSKDTYYFMTKGGMMRPKMSSSGYYKFSASKNGKYKNFNIHRLLAELFIPNPNRYPQVNHKDGDKGNNALGNLEWCTPSQNGLHAYRVLGNVTHSKGKFGKDSTRAKPVIQKDKDGNVIKVWDAGMDAARAGFTSSQITRCCQGKYKTHKGYIWEYA